MTMFKRILKLELPARQSAFLWGARKTGKSTYLEEHFPKAVYYDLLKTDVFLQLSKNPHEFREEILALSAEQISQPIIVDEVQKIPQLLDEIHWLIEHSSVNFILCGSSARKLKKEASNLLGGRAWRFEFYPLVYPEIPDFNLLHALNNGLIPSHYIAKDAHRFLRAYVQDYLTHEIKSEGLVRNLPAFARFLDAISHSHGELTNFANIARDCGVDAKTVREYYQILVDTLLGYFLDPYIKHVGREIITSTPKFYLFDVGLANYLQKKSINKLKGSEAGKSFEHYIFMELIAYRGLKELNFDITYWRTKSGLEVDFILGKGEIAIEVKIAENVALYDLKGLQAFQEEHNPKKAYVVCLAPRARKIKLDDDREINILPWEQFLKMLWHKEII